MTPPRVIRSPTRHPTPQSTLHIFHTLRCVKLLSTHLASALGYTFVTHFQVADPPANPQNVLHICQDTLSVRYVAHLSHLVSALGYTFVTPLQVADPASNPLDCVTHLSHLVSALRNTFVNTPCQCVALHICHTSSVRCVILLSSHLVSALRYTFVTPLQVADPLSDPSECVQHHNTRGNTKRKPPCTNEELIETLYTARSAARGAKSLASNEVRRPIFEDFSLEVQTCILCNESK
jgi:hypothetical protein